MKHVPDSRQEADRPRDLDELRRRLARRLSDSREGWRRCNNRPCRRRKQCCGDDPVLTCADDGRPRRTVSPEESAKMMSRLYHEIKTRRAALAAGAPLPDDEESLRKLREQARAQRHRPAAPGTRASSPELASEPPPPPVDAPKLAPEQQARIDRAWNDYVAGLEKPKRERRPRITQL
jgi:hypothetical protein